MDIKEKFYNERKELFLSDFDKIKKKKYFKSKLHAYKIIARKYKVSTPLVQKTIENTYPLKLSTKVAS